MLSCALMSAFSEFAKPVSLEDEQAKADGSYVPVYIPILISFSMPFLIATTGMLCRYAQEKRGIDPVDFTLGVFFVQKLLFIIIGIFMIKQQDHTI